MSLPCEPASERKHGVCADVAARHVAVFDDLVAHQVGQRHLGGRDQVEIGTFEAEQVFPELGQLPGAVQAVGIDHVGHIGLGVAVLDGVRVEHELGQRPVQARQRPAHHGEA